MIEGQRSITTASAENCAKSLGLVDRQVNFFLKLVEIDQASSDLEKARLLHELRAMLPHAKKHQLPLDDIEYLSHWLFPVIRELCALPDFAPESHWIERRLRTPVPRAEIDACLTALVRSNYIFKDESGRYQVRDDLVVSTDELHSMAVRNFHRKILDQSKDVLELVPMEEREFAALTLMMPESKIADLKARLKNFRNELHEWAATCCLQDEGNTVIQCNFQVYPQNRNLEKKKS